MHVACSTLYEEMRSFGAGLALLGVKTGDTICQFSENSARWLVADQGVMLSGGANAVRGANVSTQELAYIMKHSQCTGLILEDAGALSNLVPHMKTSGQRVRFVVVLWGDVSVSVRQQAGVAVLTYDDVCSPPNGFSIAVSTHFLDQLLPLRRHSTAPLLFFTGQPENLSSPLKFSVTVLATLHIVDAGCMPCWIR